MDELEARIEALERAVTDGDHDLSELAAEGETRDRLVAVETELGELTDRVAELEAATQALRGYVGNVRAVNRDVEQRADAALAKAESLESAIVGDQPRERPDHNPAGGTDTPDRSGDTAAVETNRPPGTNTALNSAATTGERQQAAGTRERGVASTTADGRAGTAEPAGRGHTASDRHGRCGACGQPTETATDNDTHGSSRGTAASGIGPGSTANRESAGETGDPLEGVFETEERTNGDNGAFDRIRQML